MRSVPETARGVVRGCRESVLAGRVEPGEHVLDSAPERGPTRSSPRRWSGTTGRVIGIDMTPEMLAKARGAAADAASRTSSSSTARSRSFRSTTRRFDVVISNGVIDLIPDKDAVFSAIFRVLRPGGRIQLADVTIQTPVSEEGSRNIDLWTG